MKMEHWFNGFFMDNYGEFWKRNVKVDTWLEIFLDLGHIFCDLLDIDTIIFGHFRQLVKTKIKVIKAKEE